MQATLITMLGRGRMDARTGYRSARYVFGDGAAQEGSAAEQTTPFFGLALMEHLQPQTVVILGTAGSMWGVLVEQLAKDDEEEALRVALLDAELAGVVTQDLLDRAQGLLRRALGRDVLPRLIPLGRDKAEQLAILDEVSAALPRVGRVHFDMTHGLRSMTLLGLLSAFMVEKIRPELKLGGVWYGALDMTEGDQTPVLRLDGLQQVQAWVDALSRFDASGNYAVFAPLLVADGLPQDKARCLIDAAFFEATSNVPDAARRLRSALPDLQALRTGPSALFREPLLRRLRWVSEHDLAEQQRLLALRALDRGDFLRAVVFGLESLLTRLCKEADLDPLVHANRETVDQQFKAQAREGAHPDWKRQAYWSLKNLRNAMAHGTLPQIDQLRNTLRDAERLEREVSRVLSQLHTTPG